MNKFRIENASLTPEVQKAVMDGFAQHAIEEVGFDGGVSPFSFVAYDGETLAGVIDCKFFWGSMHIRWLFVFPPYRGMGLGTMLMEAVESYVKKHGCCFVCVETMDYQAVDFYQRLGFRVEFSRGGYARNTTFHYLRKNL